MISKEVYHKLWQENKLSFMQSWAWGEFKGGAVRFLWEDKIPITAFVKKFFAYIPKFANEEIIKDLPESFYADLRKELKVKMLLIEPNIQKSRETYIPSFVKQARSIQPNETDIVSLIGTDEELLSRMDKDTRYEIRKAVKNGCAVSIADSSNAVDVFYDVMKQIYGRTKYIMYGKEYFKKAYEKMNPDGLCRIFVVKKENETVGAMMHYMDRECAYEAYGGATDYGKKLSANYLLKWEAMRVCRDEGYKYFDQWGVAPKQDDEFIRSHPLFRISKFKEGFGGEYTEFVGQWIYGGFVWRFLYKMGILFNKTVVKIRATLRK